MTKLLNFGLPTILPFGIGTFGLCSTSNSTSPLQLKTSGTCQELVDLMLATLLSSHIRLYHIGSSLWIVHSYRSHSHSTRTRDSVSLLLWDIDGTFRFQCCHVAALQGTQIARSQSLLHFLTRTFLSTARIYLWFFILSRFIIGILLHWNLSCWQVAAVGLPWPKRLADSCLVEEQRLTDAERLSQRQQSVILLV